MPKTKLKIYTQEELDDKYIGKRGTPTGEKFEFELNMMKLGYMIKQARKHRNLTQEQLGKLVGVQKALNAEISFKIKVEAKYLEVP